MAGLEDLSRGLEAATGADRTLDDQIASVLDAPPAAYTSSVPDCRRLAALRLPAARLHVGYGVSGIFPYAALIRGTQRWTAEAPTVPLAILRALLQALPAA